MFAIVEQHHSMAGNRLASANMSDMLSSLGFHIHSLNRQPQ